MWFETWYYYMFLSFVKEEPIHEPQLLVIVGGVGLLVNVIGLVLLYGRNII